MQFGNLRVRRSAAGREPVAMEGSECVGVNAPRFDFSVGLLSILPLLGTCITVVLTVGYARKEPIPCGLGDGCNDLMYSKYSQLLGVSTPLLGLVTYMVLAILSAMFLFGNRLRALPGMLLISLVGAIVSLILAALASFHIRTLCSWCLASAITMTLTFGASSVAVRSLLGCRNFGNLRHLKVLFAGAAIGCLVISGYVIGTPTKRLSLVDETKLRAASITQLVPRDNLRIGSDTLHTTVVIFLDLECTACTYTLPKLVELQSRSEGFRLVVRNFTHSKSGNAYGAAVYAEAMRALRPGPAFILAVCEKSERNVPIATTCIEVAQEQNLPVGSLRTDPKLMVQARSLVDQDLDAGTLLGIKGTPVLILVEKGEAVSVTNLTELEFRFGGK